MEENLRKLLQHDVNEVFTHFGTSILTMRFNYVLLLTCVNVTDIRLRIEKKQNVLFIYNPGIDENPIFSLKNQSNSIYLNLWLIFLILMIFSEKTLFKKMN